MTAHDERPERARHLERAADRCDELADVAELMGDDATAGSLRSHRPPEPHAGAPPARPLNRAHHVPARWASTGRGHFRSFGAGPDPIPSGPPAQMTGSLSWVLATSKTATKSPVLRAIGMSGTSDWAEAGIGQGLARMTGGRESVPRGSKTTSPLQLAVRCALVAAVTLVGSACGLPVDPEGTLAEARGGELHVGAVHRPPWVVVDDGEVVGGVEAELVRGFAERIDAEPVFHTGHVDAMMEALQQYRLDLVVGGLTSGSPWKSRVAFTPTYFTGDLVVREPLGIEMSERGHVMAIPRGENATLLEITEFLKQQRNGINALLRQVTGR